MEEFVKSVRQAGGGEIVVLIYHGVPDMEHTACSLDPAVFKLKMQYLKDNHYKVAALRDLAEYIDPAKAANPPRLTQTVAGAAQIAVPIKLAGDLTVDVTVRDGLVILPGLVSGTVTLTGTNTYNGKTTVRQGTLSITSAKKS